MNKFTKEDYDLIVKGLDSILDAKKYRECELGSFLMMSRITKKEDIEKLTHKDIEKFKREAEKIVEKVFPVNLGKKIGRLKRKLESVKNDFGAN